MGRFETEVLASTENFAALADLSGHWIDSVHDRRSPKMINLDLDPTFSPTHGDPTLVADDNLHPSGKVYIPWADGIVPLAELALLEEETP